MSGVNLPKVLGKLAPVELRDHWISEAADFTPWLSTPEGLSLLSEAIGIPLELEGTEVSVGVFNADIIAIDGNSKTKVVIENQLEKTDHDHLGKTITYASGVGAETIVWIAKKFTEEHRRAFDFLNEHTSPSLKFFGVEVELWRIGGSLPAPMFNVVSSPNAYLSAVKEREKELGATDVMYLDFWTEMKEYCTKISSKLKLPSPPSGYWIGIAIGRSNFGVSLSVSKQKKRIGCELYISGKNANAAFGQLLACRTEIEEVLGPLEWQDLPHSQDCRIVQYKNEIDVTDRTNWVDIFAWLRDRGEKFVSEFSPRVKAMAL